MTCAFESCGGDLVGRWSLFSSCGPDRVVGPSPLSGCADGSTVTASYRLRADEETFLPDGGYSNKATLTNRRYVYNLGRACVNAIAAQRDAGVPTCEALDALLASDLTEGSSVHCTADGDGCTCAVVVPDLVTKPSVGSWSSKNNVLTTVGNGTTLARSYCVRAGQLQLKDAWTLSFVFTAF